MLVSLTVGKVDAGVAVLLTHDKRLIEFPSILLPSTIQSGSIVDITVSQNHAAEAASSKTFSSLQSTILQRYGLNAPSTPVLRLRNTTQTSIVLEWDPIELATSTLRTLTLYRNGQKAGTIPRPSEQHATKISGLQPNTEVSFYLVLRTSAGTYTSNTITTRTHEMTNLTGITITPGVLPAQLADSLERACERINCKITEQVQIDTTHFICTEPRGEQWQKAVDGNIPVVRPEWLEGCEREGRIIGVRDYYLDADPRLRTVGANPNIQGQAQAPVITSRKGSTPQLAQSSQAQQAPKDKELPVRPQVPPETATEAEVEDGEPGPEVAESKELPARPHDEDEASEAEGDEDAEEEDREESKESVSPVEEVEPQKRRAKVEDEKGELEDVAL